MGFLLNTSALCGIFACEVTQYGVQFILTLMSYTNGLMNSLVVILSEAKNPPPFRGDTSLSPRKRWRSGSLRMTGQGIRPLVLVSCPGGHFHRAGIWFFEAGTFTEQTKSGKFGPGQFFS